MENNTKKTSTYIEVKAQTRAKLAEKINETINQIGAEKVIAILNDEGGKFAGNTVFASARAYIYYITN